MLVDDHAVVRAGLAAILNYEDDIEVVGQSADGLQAVRSAKELMPDVIIMDLVMPGLSGIEATARIAAEIPDAKVIVLTSYGSSDDIDKVLRVGALGAVTKTASNDFLVQAIRMVSEGRKVISPELAQLLKTDPPVPELTQRQLDILQSVTCGFTNQEIARQFGISANGVKRHLEGIFSKLGASTRSEAVAIALRKQLLKI